MIQTISGDQHRAASEIQQSNNFCLAFDHQPCLVFSDLPRLASCWVHRVHNSKRPPFLLRFRVLVLVIAGITTSPGLCLAVIPLERGRPCVCALCMRARERGIPCLTLICEAYPYFIHLLQRRTPRLQRSSILNPQLSPPLPPKDKRQLLKSSPIAGHRLPDAQGQYI
jgi:hypothetical protein